MTDQPLLEAAIAPTRDSLCPSCGAARLDRYCPKCGEKRLDAEDLSLRSLLGHVVSDLLNLDGRLFRTLLTLYRFPGKLTAEYRAGRQQPYIRPLQLYVVISALFFFVIPHIGIFRYDLDGYLKSGLLGTIPAELVGARLQATGASLPVFEDQFNRELEEQKRTLLIFLVPAFALALHAVLWRRRYPFAVHFVFSVHFFTALLLFIAVGLPLLVFLLGLAISWTTGESFHSLGELWTSLSIFIPAAAYLGIASRRSYGLGLRAALGLAAFLDVALIALIALLYRELLFFVTLLFL